jgi:hypothetical protein
MCMLTVYPAGVGVHVGRIENGADINDDGHGFAIVDLGDRVRPPRILRGGGMDSRAVIAEFAELRAAFPAGPALFHSRWATHGYVGVANCHPFTVGGDPRTVLAHNGVLPADAWPGQGDTRSDTRVLAERIMHQRYRRLDSGRVQDKFLTWLGSNKVAILTINPKYRHRLYLFGESRGEWVDGVWYSNGDHARQSYKSWLSLTGWDDENYGPSCGTGVGTVLGPRKAISGVVDEGLGGKCEYCGQWRVNKAWNLCEECWTCQDCLDDAQDCQCWTPDAARRVESYGGES